MTAAATTTPEHVTVDLSFGRRRYIGRAKVVQWGRDRKAVRVWPSGWKRAIWISANEIVGGTTEASL